MILSNILFEVDHAFDHAEVVVYFVETKLGLFHFAFALETIKEGGIDVDAHQGW